MPAVIVKRLSAALGTAVIAISLGGCPAQRPPIAPNAVYCEMTSEPPISGGMKAVFVGNEPLWRPLTNWLDAGVTTRRERCG